MNCLSEYSKQVLSKQIAKCICMPQHLEVDRDHFCGQWKGREEAETPLRIDEDFSKWDPEILAHLRKCQKEGTAKQLPNGQWLVPSPD